MTFVELFLVALGLSMDAFAVALCKGLSFRKFVPKDALTIAVFFGGFQALMPLIGWFLGSQFEQYIVAYDHWIAFALLSFIGGKMIYDSRHSDDEDIMCEAKLDLRELALLAIATSVDALAVGITFAFLKISIVPAITTIGVTTLTLSFVGVAIGNKFGAKFKGLAELAGGVVLILIGVRILFEHLQII